MTDFELFLACLLIPAAYAVIYIAGRYNMLDLICQMLERKWMGLDTESIVKRLKSEIEDNPEASLSVYRAGLYKAIDIVQGKEQKEADIDEAEIKCDSGWIPIEKGILPSENEEVNVTIEEIDGKGYIRYTSTSWLQDGVWVVKKNHLRPRVIAWKQKDVPYRQKGE